MKTVDQENETARYQFSQGTGGIHFIKDTQHTKDIYSPKLEVGVIRIDTNKLTMTDIRELLNGLGNLFQSIASSTWDMKLEPYESSKTTKATIKRIHCPNCGYEWWPIEHVKIRIQKGWTIQCPKCNCEITKEDYQKN